MKYLSGINAIPVRLKLRFSMLKYLVNRSRYPLFVINKEGKGLIDSMKMLHRIRMCKIVKHNRKFYFSLSVPHWPSAAFDKMAGNGGLNITSAGTSLKKQVDNIIIAVTPRCQYNCIHCYEQPNLSDKEGIPLIILTEIINTLQTAGVSIITLSGGEPMLRYNDLITILKTADTRATDFHIHTSGYNVTFDKARQLRKAGLQAAGIGLDDVDRYRNDAFRKYKGAYNLSRKALECFGRAGIFTYVNTCPSRELIRSGDIYKFIEMMRTMKVGIIRFLEPKPCGAYINNKDSLLTREDRTTLTQIYTDYNTKGKLSDYPLICYDAFAEAPENLGCMMAGLSHFYINSSGEVQPCVFLPVSFGNVMRTDINSILQKMRTAIPEPLHIACPSIQLADVMKERLKNGSKFPVPFSEIGSEFELLKENNPNNDKILSDVKAGAY